MIDIFAEAFKANSKLNSMADTKKTLKESRIKKLAKENAAVQKKSLNCNSKLAINKIKFTEDVNSVEPEDDIMVVYTDVITDNMSEADIEDAKQELIGQNICKCGVCGANYVCDCEEKTSEDLLVADEDDFEEDLSESFLFSEDLDNTDAIEDDSDECDMECPVCGADDNQIVVGEIAPIDTDEDTETPDIVPTDEHDVETTEDAEETPEFSEENLVDTDTDVEESCKTKNEGKRGPQAGARYGTTDDPNPDPRFQISSNVDGVIANVSSEYDAKKTIASLKRDDRQIPSRKNKNIEYTYKELRPAKPRVEPKEPKYLDDYDDDYDRDRDFYELDEHSANRVFSRFARENFENVSSVKFTSGRIVDGELSLEGFVRTKKGNRRPITITSVGFKCNESTNKIKVIEKGPFTESATVVKGKVPFVVECAIKGKTIRFTGMKYNYIVKESKDSYSVSGVVKLTESKKN